MKTLRRFTYGLIICVIASILLCGCNKAVSNVSFFVKGCIEYDTEITDIEILINGKTSSVKIGDDGAFEINGLKKGDVVTFNREGYSFDSITVSKSVEGLIVVPQILTYTVAVEKTGDGEISGEGSYDYGQEVTLGFTPSEHFEFTGLYNGETLLTAENEYSFTINSDINYQAVFTAISYPISFSKTYDDATASAPETATFGEVITLSAEDCDKYVFAKWIVNDEDITDKTYEYTIDTETPVIEAAFLLRLSLPELSKQQNVISWEAVEGADGYIVTLDDSEITVSGESVDVTKIGLYTGSHTLSVTATGEGFGNSLTADITFDYVRLLATPQNAGIVREADKTYFSFSKVLGASTYKVSVNGSFKDIGDYDYTETLNTVKIDICKLLTNPGEYTFTAKAVGETESLPTDEVRYTYTPKLAAPSASIQAGVVSWSHADNGVSFAIAVDGVIVHSSNSSGSFDISGIVEGTSAEVTVVAEKQGYTSAETSLLYTK